jgi:uncharacterized protein (DUF58 family)
VTSLLDAGLRSRLRNTRLQPRSARATRGIGERKSRAKGAGIEFADYRPYQIGDDFRYLDRHVHARTGHYVVRQYAVEQKLAVGILVDLSGSMGVGTPSKARSAMRLAAALAFVALAGGDEVALGAFSGGSMDWHRRLASPRTLPEALEWLARRAQGGSTDLVRVARRSVRRLPPSGLVIVLSDWMVEDVGQAVGVWAAAGQEVIAIQVTAPEEEALPRFPPWALHLIDAETRTAISLPSDEHLAERYGHELEAWRSEVRESVRRWGGRFIPIRSDANLERDVLPDWRRHGLIT